VLRISQIITSIVYEPFSTMFIILITKHSEGI